MMYMFCSSHAYSGYKCLLGDDVEAVARCLTSFSASTCGQPVRTRLRTTMYVKRLQLQMALLQDSTAQLCLVVVRAAADVYSANRVWRKLNHRAE